MAPITRVLAASDWILIRIVVLASGFRWPENIELRPSIWEIMETFLTILAFFNQLRPRYVVFPGFRTVCIMTGRSNRVGHCCDGQVFTLAKAGRADALRRLQRRTVAAVHSVGEWDQLIIDEFQDVIENYSYFTSYGCFKNYVIEEKRQTNNPNPSFQVCLWAIKHYDHKGVFSK